MSNRTCTRVEKTLLLSFSAFFVLLSSFCWSQIIVENYSKTNPVTFNEVTQEGGKVSRLKENALVFTGVLMVIVRHLPFDGDK